MNDTKQSEETRELLIKHYKAYPCLKIQDIIKFIFQSAFGCEHMVSDENAALDYVKREYGSVSKDEPPKVEQLDGEYCRVYLSCLNHGLKPETIARLFYLSAKKEKDGIALVEKKIQTIKELISKGELPFDSESFDKAIDAWRAEGYPAVHHSDDFRYTYRPAYRVISKRYVDFLPIFTEIDKLTLKSTKPVVVALEGGSASGKTTLANMLEKVYGCTVFHMDDFFLRPEQRTPERFAEIGGNVDRERFEEEVLCPLRKNEAVCYRRFDCHTQTLGEPTSLTPAKLTIIEGVYSTHPAFLHYYDLSVFLDIDPEYQRKRILLRNAPPFADRFFNEWIPLENRYFDGTNIKERSDLILSIQE